MLSNLGLVENMSYFICDNCDEKHYIFSNEGAKKEAEKFQIPFLRISSNRYKS